MNLLIRADSSSQIGLGHIMRDLVLAQHYPDDTILFACRNLPGNIIDSIPYSVHILASNKPEELIDLIQTRFIDLLIIDHYDIDATMEKQIKEQTAVSLLCLDDTYEKHYCDILLNHNISADKSRYEGLVPPECEIRCGSEYTLIRDEFKTEKEKEREKQYDIFISMGGTDPTNATLDILKTLSNTYQICVVTTSGNPHLGELETFASEKKNITLLVNSKSIAKLLHESRLALITPSVMVHEVLFMQIPFIAIKTADNQKDMFEYLQKEKYIVLEEWNVNAITRFYNT
jgi:UDP-2,4-diacetamido-2,4,6-trideoxy-beta-L-altropyranose hydrolase